MPSPIAMLTGSVFSAANPFSVRRTSDFFPPYDAVSNPLTTLMCRPISYFGLRQPSCPSWDGRNPAAGAPLADQAGAGAANDRRMAVKAG